MGFYSIHLSPGLTAVERAQAVRAGPRAVGASTSYAELLTRAGFVDVRAIDVTDEFLRVTKALVEVSGQLAVGLRRVQGDAEFQQFQRERKALVGTIEDGLLRRSLFLASAPMSWV